ncbi:hypothetical protein BH11BAC2_BH11BAC2_12630 [soil metagenome]
MRLFEGSWIKIARQGLLFLISTVVVYGVVVLILSTIKVGGIPLIYRCTYGLVWKGGLTYKRYQSFDENKNYDVLVFGSSRANRGINPKIFEEHQISCFNLATDDQTPLNSRVLIEEFVTKSNCKIVILDLYDRIFAQDDNESSMDLIQNVSKTKTAFKMMSNVGSIRSLNSFAVRLSLLNSPPVYHREDSLYKGFRFRRHEKFKSGFFNYQYIVRPGYIDDLDQIITYLKEIDVQLILVCQPMPFHHFGIYHQQMLEDIRPVLEKHQIQLHDFTNDIQIGRISNFIDECHLNKKGADEYSELIIDSLFTNHFK